MGFITHFTNLFGRHFEFLALWRPSWIFKKSNSFINLGILKYMYIQIYVCISEIAQKSIFHPDPFIFLRGGG